MSETPGLPLGWNWMRVDEIADIGPKKSQPDQSSDSLFNFVPMPAVQEDFGGINTSNLRPFSEVKKGYTQFKSGDVLFAKITPCMENGKIAVVPDLDNVCGYGSTEFHVLRSNGKVIPRWLAHYFAQSSFRRDAQRSMTGSAGQLRVSKQWLSEQRIPVAPKPQQSKIVEKVEELFSDLDAGVAALKRTQANLKRYRASVLKAAVEGKLTEQWRAENPSVEPASVLLERILADRRKKWEEEQLKKYEAKGKKPSKGWRDKYKEPPAPDAAALPKIPPAWAWVTVDQMCTVIADCPHSTPKWSESGKVCVRTTEFRPGRLILEDARYVSEETFSRRIARIRPRAGDVLYSREGGILGIACVIPEGVSLCMGQRMMLLRPATRNEYLMHVLNSPSILNRVRRLTGGSASPHLNVRDIIQFPIPLPPLEEQETLLREVDHRWSVIDAVDKEAEASRARAASLRQAILESAFEGRLVCDEPHRRINSETELAAVAQRTGQVELGFS